MRVQLAQLAPRPGELATNLDRVEEVVRAHAAGLHLFPELFLSGYAIGDRLHQLALLPGGPESRRLGRLAAARRTTIVVGAPMRHARAGEIENAALVAGPDGKVVIRAKRFLPTYGPFAEGQLFTPTDRSAALDVGGTRVGVQICYDVYFPEVSRQLALDGAELLVILSAAPITSRRLFDHVLPARAVENAVPLVYVNRVGVEDGLVFGGGSQALDARGELVPGDGMPSSEDRSTEACWTVELDLTEAARWRPFRPVLRDISAAARPLPAAPDDRARSRRAPTPARPRRSARRG